jgi:putative AlgH/UPF0301 family transcriptional regulator
MSSQKLSFFIIVAMILACAVVRLNRSVEGSDETRPHTRSHTALGSDGSFARRRRPTSEPDRSCWVKGMCGGKEILPTIFLPFQSRNADALAVGKLLVASRDLTDPNFAQTVILLVHYDAQGVLGLVLNRRTHVPLSRVLQDLKAAKDRSDPVYLGGPVDTPSVFALFQSSAKIEGAERIFDGIYLISAKNVFEQAIGTRPDPGVFHVYLGYAGWNQDQLRKEVELGAWFIFPAETSTVFNSDPDSLWTQMIRKTELKLARSLPADPRTSFASATN